VFVTEDLTEGHKCAPWIFVRQTSDANMQWRGGVFGTSIEHTSLDLAFFMYPRVIQIAQNSHNLVPFFCCSQNMSAFRGILSHTHSDSKSYFWEAAQVLLFADQERRPSTDAFNLLGEGRTMASRSLFFGGVNSTTSVRMKRGRRDTKR